MTRKHFIATAEIIANLQDPALRLDVAKQFAGIFARENSNFDKARFLSACGAES